MEKQLYYDNPTQVKFRDFGAECWVGGLAYRDEIICLECGAIIEIDDIYENAEEIGFPNPIVSLSWISLSEECLGSEALT